MNKKRKAINLALRSMLFRRSTTLNILDTDGGENYLYFVDPDMFEVLALPRKDQSRELFALFDLTDEALARARVPRKLPPVIAAEAPSDLEFYEQPLEANFISAANAVLATEYMFSGQLPGQKNNPLLIANEHIQEIRLIVDSLTQQFQAIPSHAPIWKTLNWEEMQRIWTALIDDGRLEWSQVADQITQAVVKIVGSDDFDFVAFARLAKVFRERRFVPAGRYGSLFTYRNPPPRELVIELRDAIQRDKSSNTRPSGRTAVEADAVALASIIRYNQVRTADHPIALLITRDVSVEKAYNTWFEAQPKGQHYALRHPSQYHPTLNLRDMPGGPDGEQYNEKIFRELHAVVENITQPYADASSSGEYIIPRHRREMLKLIDAARLKDAGGTDQRLRFDTYVDNLNAFEPMISPLWADLASYSTYAKLQSLKKLEASFDGFIQQVVQGGHKVHALLEEASGDFLSTASDVTAQAIIWRHISWATSDYVARAPATFLSDPTGAPLSSALVAEFNRLEPHDRIGPLRALLDEHWSRADAQDRCLAIGYVALEFGVWETAKVFLGRAAQGAPDNSLLQRDARFAHCIAARFALPHNRDKAQTAIDQVVGTLNTERSATLRFRPKRRLWRISSELSAAHLSQAALCLPSTGNPHADKPAAGLYARDAIGSILQAVWAIDGDRDHLLDPASQRFSLGILEQLHSNAWNVKVWRNFGLIPDFDLAELDHAIAALDELLTMKGWVGPDSVHDRSYPVALYKTLSEAKTSRTTAQAALKIIEGAFSMDKASGAIFELPYIDECELRAMQEALGRTSLEGTLFRGDPPP